VLNRVENIAFSQATTVVYTQENLITLDVVVIDQANVNAHC